VSKAKRKSRDNQRDRVHDEEGVTRFQAEFLANVSHELRTPLHAIVGYTELLIDGAYGQITGEQEQTVGFIRENAQELLSLVNNLLDLSRIETGRADLILQSFDLRDLISDVISQFKPLAEAKHLSLSSSVPIGNAAIRTDRGKLKQILVNLVGNAIKFTDSGHVIVAIDAATNPKSKNDAASPRLSISVQDTGIGIPSDQLGRIFEKYYQVDGSARRSHESTGLGLYITKQLVDLLSGSVDIQSTPGNGTTVTISLPTNFEEVQGIQRLGSRITASSSETPSATGDPKRLVLVVSEQPDIARILTAGLGSRHYHVRSTRNGEEAVALAVKLHPLVVLLNAHPSSATLWSVFQELKTKPETSDIPIIFLSNDTASSVRPSLRLATLPNPRNVLRTVRATTINGRKNVLIVDDEPSFRDVLKRILDGEGYHLYEAATGREAIAKLEAEKPDLILLDLNLPDTDGWGVMQYMTQQPKFKDVGVLVISGLMLDERETEEIKTREYDYIYKGEFKVDDVLERVADLLEAS
jgi:CheY-like chemotaxis protein